MKPIFAGDWKTWEDVENSFYGALPKPFPGKLLYAECDRDAYDGHAVLVWKVGQNYWINMASHCSCYGLSECWNPEFYGPRQVLIDALKKYDYGVYKNALVALQLNDNRRPKKLTVTEVELLTKVVTKKHGHIRVEQWTEGLVLWVGGEIKWKSWE